MYRVSKQYEFPAAHVLSRHPGRCRYVHGHNYTVELTLAAAELDENSMVCDFHVLKMLLADYLDTLDHAILLNSDDREHAGQPHPRRVVFEGRDPTSEVLARAIFDRLASRLAAGGGKVRTASGEEYTINPKVRLEKVRVWETPTSWAEYEREE